MGQGEQGRYRMKIATIKLRDPYAIEIVDGSDHVVVHTFNDEKNEWNKNTMDAALFVYRRNRRPYHFLLIDYFIKNGEVEEITAQKRVKIDAPLMFYKNEQNCAYSNHHANKNKNFPNQNVHFNPSRYALFSIRNCR